MSNGVDNIYDTSDTRRRLYELGQQRRELLVEKEQRKKDVIGTGVNALKFWQTSQAGKTVELLGLKDEFNMPLYETDPEHIGRGFIEKFFTPAGGRVMETEAGGKYLEANKPLDTGRFGMQGPTTAGEQVTQSSEELSKTSEKFFGGNLGRWLAGAGTLASGYDTIKNWDPKDPAGNLLKIGKTAVGVGLLKNPAMKLLGANLGLWGIGLTALDWLRKK